MKKQEKLVVRLSGGLGNQLFKLMAGVKLSETLGKELAVDISWFRYFHDKHGRVHERHFELDYFPNLSNFEYFTSRNLFFNKKCYQIARRLPTKLLKEIGFVSEENFPFQKGITKARFMDGRFEDLRFMPSANRMKELLTYAEPKSDWLQERLKAFGREFIALHIRTGDYLKLPLIYGFLTSHYYTAAISQVIERLGDLPVVLFSEDLEVALELLKGKVNFDFIQGPEAGISSGETLQLMSLGVGVISAHSTFSWWAAMLGKINGTTEVVTVPSRFLESDDPGVHRLRPEDWLVIQV